MRDRRLVENVQQLHSRGMGIREIARNLNLDSSSVSRWCRKSSMEDLLANPLSYQEKQRAHFFTFDKLVLNKINKNQAKMLLSILYWCEGAKYPGTNKIEFVSSDEKMQSVFIKLMRISFAGELDESKFRVMLQLHTSQDIQQSTEFWSKLLNIPYAQFVKPSITIGKNSRYRHIYKGTCGLRYQDYRLLLRIMGMYNQISDQINN